MIPCRKIAAVLAAALIVLALAALAPSPAAADDLDKAEALLKKLEAADYEVLPLSRGYGLHPRSDDRDFRLIEAIEERVYVDGKALAGSALAARVGPAVARDLEALARVATEARALELEREIEVKQQELEKLRQEAQDPPEPERRDAAVQPAEKKPGPSESRPDDRPRRRRQRDENVIVAGTHKVGRGEVSAGVVLIGGFLEVEEGGRIAGDATVVGGGVSMNGKIDGSLVVVGGANSIGSKARIDEDLVTIAAQLRRDRRSQVGGEVVQLAVGDWRDFRDVWRKLRRGHDGWDVVQDRLESGGPFDFSWMGLFASLFWTVFLGLLALACVLIAPQRVRAISIRSSNQPWRSGLVGLLVQILILPVMVMVALILLVTIIGIPLLVVVPPLMVLAFLLYNLLGFAAVATSAGRLAEKHIGIRTGGNRFLLILAGIVLIQGWSLVGEVFSMIGGSLGFSILVLLAFGFLVEYAAWTIGLGATVLERFSAKPPPAAPADSGTALIPEQAGT